MNAPAVESAVAPDEPSQRRAWLGRASWALLDQGLFSASNFLLQIFLARYLIGGESAYGAFSVAFTWFLLVGTFHTSLLVEPMLVFGPSKFAQRLGSYLGVLAAGNFMLSAVGAVFMSMVGVIYWITAHEDIAIACWSLAGASPFIFFLWLMRRACYVRLSPKVAAIVGIGYMALMVGGLGAMYLTDLISTVKAMIVMGVSCLIAATVLAIKERVRWEGLDSPIFTETTLRHLRFGRWAAASGLVMFIPGQVYYWLLPLFVDVGEAGVLRAMNNIFLPVIMANAALVGLILPGLVRSLGTPHFRKVLSIALLVLAGGPTLLWLICGLFNYEIMHFLYAGRYDKDSHLLWLLGLSPMLMGAMSVYQAVLNAHNRPDRVFFASAAGAVVTMTLGIWLTAAFGLTGVCAAYIVSSLIMLIVTRHFARRMPATPPPEEPERVADLAAAAADGN